MQVIVSDVRLITQVLGRRIEAVFFSYLMCNTECGFSNYNLLFEAIMQVIVSDV